jgi:hypothetical protein
MTVAGHTLEGWAFIANHVFNECKCGACVRVDLDPIEPYAGRDRVVVCNPITGSGLRSHADVVGFNGGCLLWDDAAALPDGGAR